MTNLRRIFKSSWKLCIAVIPKSTVETWSFPFFFGKIYGVSSRKQ